MTAQEREFALQQFRTSRDNFIKSITGLPSKQWTFKPAPDRWSVAEVAEQITISESTRFGLVQTKIMQSPAAPEKHELVKGKDQLILEKMQDRSHKAQAPEFLRPTGRWANEVELTKAFEGSRKTKMEYIRTINDDSRDHFFDHPVFGPLDGHHWLFLISAHSARHTCSDRGSQGRSEFPARIERKITNHEAHEGSRKNSGGFLRETSRPL